MDVGNPSNFIRIQEIHKNNFEALKSNLSSYSFSDDDTRKALKELYEDFSYISDPHGAVGYLGCKAYLTNNPNAHCIFLETAHPTKFLNVVEEAIPEPIELPAQIIAVMDKKKESIEISTYDELKKFLIGTISEAN